MKPLALGLCLMIFDARRPRPRRPGHRRNRDPRSGNWPITLGTWKGEGEAKGGPFGPAGKLSSTTTCEWFAGGFQPFAAARKTAHGETQLQHPWIRRQEEVLRRVRDQQPGDSEYTTGGTIEDGRKTFIVDIDAGGKPGQVRYTERQVSPTLFTYRARSIRRWRAVDGDRGRQGRESRITGPAPASIGPIAAQVASRDGLSLPDALAVIPAVKRPRPARSARRGPTSGEALAARLGISRSAVHKRMESCANPASASTQAGRGYAFARALRPARRRRDPRAAR